MYNYDFFSRAYLALLADSFNSMVRMTETEFALTNQLREATWEVEQSQTWRKLALTNRLTGLPNDVALEIEIKQRLDQRGQHGIAFTVIYIDGKRTKEVNDSWGHEVGDFYIKQIGAYLLQTVRSCARDRKPADIVCHPSGDEFYVVLTDAPIKAGERVVATLHEYCRGVGGGAIRLNAGLSRATVQSWEGFLALLKRAEQKMYADKENDSDRRR